MSSLRSASLRSTLFPDSKYPLIDAWAGAIIGVIVPLLIFLILKKLNRQNYFISIFTGFCFLANGVYLGFAWVDKVGDTGEILRHGGNVISMILFGLITTSTGLFIWHQTLENEKDLS